MQNFVQLFCQVGRSVYVTYLCLHIDDGVNGRAQVDRRRGRSCFLLTFHRVSEAEYGIKKRDRLFGLSLLLCLRTHLTRCLQGCLIVIWLGFAPRTHSLDGCCSIQLSYQTATALLKKRCKVTILQLNEQADLFFCDEKDILADIREKK